MERFAAQAPLPRVRALHLPPPPTADPRANKGEFCALELEDGSLGLSYVLLDDTLARLRAQGDGMGLAGADALAVARRYAEGEGFGKTVGFAAANALTRCLFDRAGFAPPASRDSIGEMAPAANEHIGMIGLFRPLLGRVLESGARLTVVELKAELAGEAEGYRVTLDAAELESCDKVVYQHPAAQRHPGPHARPLSPRALLRHGGPWRRLPAGRAVRARRDPARRQLDRRWRRIPWRAARLRIDQPLQPQDGANAGHLARLRGHVGACPMTLELVGLALFGALAWLWYDSIHVREIAVRAARRACEAEDLQLLDDTVAIASLALARDEDSRLRLRRVYGFDYSDTGDNRRRGSLVTLGDSVLLVNTGPRLVADAPTLH